MISIIIILHWPLHKIQVTVKKSQKKKSVKWPYLHTLKIDCFGQKNSMILHLSSSKGIFPGKPALIIKNFFVQSTNFLSKWPENCKKKLSLKLFKILIYFFTFSSRLVQFITFYFFFRTNMVIGRQFIRLKKIHGKYARRT